MAGRYIANTVIFAAVEATQYTDATPAGTATNAVLVGNVNITPLDAQNIDRNILLPWMGEVQQIVGPASKKITFEVDMAGSGTAGTKPAYDALLQACGFASNDDHLLATPRWSYTPVTLALKSVTLYVYDDGVQHVYLGAMGDVEFSLEIGSAPKMKFSFIARDGGDTAVANPAATLTAYKAPVGVTAANSAKVFLGTTYVSAGATWAGLLTGGTGYGGTGLKSLKMGNKLQFTPLLGGDQIDIMDRVPSGSIELDLTAAQEVAFMTSLKANTLQTVSFVHGTVSGNLLAFFLAAGQLTNPQKVDKNGRRLISFDIRACTLAGNDEVRLMAA